MISKIKKYLNQKAMIRFLENVKKNKNGDFNYKIADTYFHLYIKGRTYSLSGLIYYDIDILIDMVCFRLYENRLSINKKFFKGIK